MYGGYVWLANARTPSRTPERLLMLVGMAGFLIMGLAIPEAFGRDGVALGIGYLIVVVVHAWLYQRVNRNIARIVPFNLAAALLVITAGIVKGRRLPTWLWAAALAVQVLSPFVLPVRGRFDIQPSHFTERHGALVIIVLGESVVDIGIGAEGHPVTVSLALSAVLGLALTAALWWAYFGAEDDERAERAMVAADPAARPALALAAYFYAYIPMLLGIVALASGVKQAIVNTGSTLPAGPCVAMGCGVALFLAGSAAFRHALRIGPERYRLAAAVLDNKLSFSLNNAIRVAYDRFRHLAPLRQSIPKAADGATLGALDSTGTRQSLLEFFADRLNVQLRDQGARHDSWLTRFLRLAARTTFC